MAEERYDRQLRLWGIDGQRLLESSSVLVLGSGTTATEVLRCLALPGVGKIVIIDDSIASKSDAAENFAVTDSDVGLHRVSAVKSFIQLQNPDITCQSFARSFSDYLRANKFRCKGRCSISSPAFGSLGLVKASPSPVSLTVGEIQRSEENEPPPICSFDLVIGAQLCLEDELALCTACEAMATGSNHLPECSYTGRNGFCMKGEIPFILLTTLGFIGTVRLWAGEYCLMRPRPERVVEDLRISNPFQELYEQASNLPLHSIRSEEKERIPYILILIRALIEMDKKAELRSNSHCLYSSASQGVFRNLTFPLPISARQQLRNIICKDLGFNAEAPNCMEAFENMHRALRPVQPSHDICRILREAAAMFKPKNEFWHMAKALSSFFEDERTIPVCPLSIDMASDSEGYHQLRKVFEDQATSDLMRLAKYLDTFHFESHPLERQPKARNQDSNESDGRFNYSGHEFPDICTQPRIFTKTSDCTWENLKTFARNAHYLKVIRYRSFAEQIKHPRLEPDVIDEIRRFFVGDKSVEDNPALTVPWALGLHAWKLAVTKREIRRKNEVSALRYAGGRLIETCVPANFDNSVLAGSPDMRTSDCAAESCLPSATECVAEEIAEELRNLWKHIGLEIEWIRPDIPRQLAAYRGCEFPATACMIGSVGAQEAIKVLCKQFEPLNNTFVWAGVERRGGHFEF